MHVELTDERIISIPLMWIPTLYNASDKDRKKFEISQNRKMIIWDPENVKLMTRSISWIIWDQQEPVTNQVR